MHVVKILSSTHDLGYSPWESRDRKALRWYRPAAFQSWATIFVCFILISLYMYVHWLEAGATVHRTHKTRPMENHLAVCSQRSWRPSDSRRAPMPEQTNPQKMDGFFVKVNGGQIQVAHCPIRACTGFPAWLPPPQFSGVFSLAKLTDWRSAPNGDAYSPCVNNSTPLRWNRRRNSHGNTSTSASLFE